MHLKLNGLTNCRNGRTTAETIVCGRRTNAYSSINCFCKAYNTNQHYLANKFSDLHFPCVVHKIQALGITLCISFDRNTSKRSWNVTKGPSGLQSADSQRLSGAASG